ncbi:hypothetical protein KA977_11345, partial [Candidatus Dependentiae bacterium]|nr:hypothetical protein [Candidatus Dependentiae bacterium]
MNFLKKRKNPTLKKKYFSFLTTIVFFIFLYSESSFCKTLEEIKKSGILSAGFFREKTSFNIDPKTGKKSGFDYELAEALANYLNVKLNIVELEWNQIFAKDENATEIEKNKIYDPYIFAADKVDIVMQEITKLEWRDKILNLVPVVKSKQILFGTKVNRQANKISDLSKSKIYIRT